MQMEMQMEPSQRPPICSVIGAVDAGKTSLLDLVRGSKVQTGEAGGITQKIGITYLSNESAILSKGRKGTGQGKGGKGGKGGKDGELTGILLVDTPGHDCFTSQRLTGIEISDLVVVVIDIFKGVGKQTSSLLKLLQGSKTPFIVAVNKIDRINNWFPLKMKNLKATLAKQKPDVKKRLEFKMNEIVLQFAELGLNAAPYYKNTDPRKFISLVPISSKSGEGVPDLLAMIDLLSKKFLKKLLQWCPDARPATGFIVEHLKDSRIGDCLTIILLNGSLQDGNEIMLQTDDGKIVRTQVKTIYTPAVDKEIKEDVGASKGLGLKQITSADMPRSYMIKTQPYDTQSSRDILSGSRFYGFQSGQEGVQGSRWSDLLMARHAEGQKRKMPTEFQTPGVYISAPTLGAAEGLYVLCKEEGVPVSGITVGPLTKKTIIRAKLGPTHYPVECPEDLIWARRYAVVLDFSDGKNLSKDLLKEAEDEGVTVINHSIVYHLVEDYRKYAESLNDKIKKNHPNLRPRCEVQFIPEFVFMKKDPILIGVRVLKNSLNPGMYLECKKKMTTTTSTGGGVMVLGKITSIEKNNKPVESAEPGDEVCIRIEPGASSAKKYEYGNDFDHTAMVRSHYSIEEARLVKKYSHIFTSKSHTK